MEIFEINGPIDYWGCMTNWVKYNLNRNKGKEVTLRINSPGGVISEALTIAQAIKDHGKVTVLLYGCCASAATFLCLSAQKVQIAKDAMWMCHNCSVLLSMYKDTKAEDLDKIIKELTSQKKTQEAFDLNIARMYAAKSGKELDKIQSLMAEERWMNAEEVKDWGFVDEVVEGSIPMTDIARAQMLQNCAAFGLSEPTFNVAKEDDHAEAGLFTRIQNYLKDVFGLEPKNVNEPQEPAEPKTEDSTNPNINPQNTEGMKKIINSVVCFLALLNLKEIEATDDKVTLTVDQMNTIETALADAKAQKTTLDAVNETLNAISDEIKDIEGTENKVKALKMLLNHAPGVAPATANQQTGGEVVNDGTDEVNKFFD